MDAVPKSARQPATGLHHGDVAAQIAWACRILASQGYADLTLGHVSARDPVDPKRMWIKRRGIALAEVSPGDVLEFDIDGDLKTASEDMHLEAVLHTEVYQRRGDVGGVVHGHPPHATAFGATDAELLNLTHDAVMFDSDIAVYEDSPDLITEPGQGEDVARTLADGSVVLLRNHGVLVAERDVPWVVLAAVTLERAVTLQAIAASLGRPRPIDADVVAELRARKYQDSLVREYWDAWIRDLRRRGLDDGLDG